MIQPRIAIIGGTSLDQLEDLTVVEEIELDTPFGKPSGNILVGDLKGIRIAFLSRHGKGHVLGPSEIPSQANIWALKSMGVEQIISVSAVGSLREDIRPLDLVIPDQLIDQTKGRKATFFGDGCVVHVSFADPFCPILRQSIMQNSKDLGVKVYDGGTYIVMEGPQFSSRAESLLYRSWGASVIGMTALPEAKLAREAEICYAVLACTTDYDCWYQGYESVSVEMVVSNLAQNAEISNRIVQRVCSDIPERRSCACANALSQAIVTNPQVFSKERRVQLGLLLDKYME